MRSGKVWMYSLAFAILFTFSLMFTACGGNTQNAPTSGERKTENTDQSKKENATTPVPTVDLATVKPNEAGQVMVVMFHNFVETPPPNGDTEYTTTFAEFEKLLGDLYDKGYRLVNLMDMVQNNISVPAGTIPMVFTFDDGTAGQFNLIDDGGTLKSNPKSAVGIMEEFNKKHPDFGLKGSFYVNLGDNTFDGAGSLEQRLKYLIDKGFEIGNHTLTHCNMATVASADKMQSEIGGNQKKMNEIINGYKFRSYALCNGGIPSSADLKQYLQKGSFEGVEYENFAILLVGANPSVSPVSAKFDPLRLPRVRAKGLKPVQCDLEWWLSNITRDAQYVSDGDPNTVTVPKAKEKDVDQNKLNGKKLVTY